MQSSVKKVMMIDDNEIDLKINGKLISITKLFDEIIVCHSAEEALAYLTKHAQNVEKLPNFILLDIQMPEMNGFEFLDEFKKLPKNITEKCPVAMLSSTLDYGDIKRAEANRFVIKLLKKPLSTQELASLIG
ncbi:MAG: response regulator [Pedobacter sp.]|nr:MAG: response regulator [Pedobacter sp.]